MNMIPYPGGLSFGRPIGFSGPMSPLPYYDDLDLITPTWGSLDTYPSPRWGLESYPPSCGCSLCSGMQAIPDLPIILSDLFYHDPYHHAHISDLISTMHSQYIGGYDPYGTSRLMEDIGKLLQREYRRNSYCGRGIGDIASQLKYLGRDISLGNPRRRGPRYGYGAGIRRKGLGMGYYDEYSPCGGRWGGRRDRFW